MFKRMSDVSLSEIKNRIKKRRMYTGDILDMESEIDRGREAEKGWHTLCKLQNENNDEMERQLDLLKAENLRLKDWETTIIHAPGEAKNICIQRFRESKFAKDLIGCWKKENAKLREEIEMMKREHKEQMKMRY